MHIRIFRPMVPSLVPEIQLLVKRKQEDKTTMINIPSRKVDIIVCLAMFLNILSCLITRWVTSNALIVRVLVDADIVEAQDSRHVINDAFILRCEVIRHTHIHDQCQRLEWDGALSDIAVRSDGASVQCPGLFGADEPGHVAFFTWCVLEGVGLEFGAIVPAMV